MAHKCFGRPEQKWGDKSLWNRQDVAIQAYLFIPLCRTHCSANYGAWRVSSWTLARLCSATAAADRRWRRRSPWPQQGAQLWFSRHLWNKTSKIELLGIPSSLLVATILRFHPLTTNIWFLSGNNEVLVKQIACENPKKLGLTYSKNHTFDDFHIKIWF